MKKRLTEEQKRAAASVAWNAQMDYSIRQICDGIVTGGFKTVRGNLMMVLQGFRTVDREHGETL